MDAVMSSPDFLTGAKTALDNSLANEFEFPGIKPLPDPLLPVERFESQLLPDGAFAEQVMDIADRHQCPPDYVAVAIMVSLGAVVGRSYQINPKQHDDWLVVPNLWGLAIGSPSKGKTPAVEAGLEHVRRLEEEAHNCFESEQRTYRVDSELAKLVGDTRRNEAKTLAKSDLGKARLKLMEATDEPEPPVCKRWLVNDTTVEKLGELLAENPNGLLVYRDEIAGLFRILDSEKNPNDRALYLEGWNGTGSYVYDRIGRGTIRIPHHVLSLLGTIQPARLASYVNSAIRHGSGDDGFMQRLQISVYPDEIKQWKLVDRNPNDEAQKAVYLIYKRLAELADRDEPVILRFSPGAQAVFNDWLTNLENNKIRNTDDHPALIAHLGKYRSLFPSLALIIHLVDHCQDEGVLPPVSEGPARKAAAWCEYLESHARRIYGDAVNNPWRTAHLILKKIKAGKIQDGFGVRDIQRPNWTGLTENDEIRKGLEALEDENYIRRRIIENPQGRDKEIYIIDPRVTNG
jgi:putative DNA primase/helicase